MVGEQLSDVAVGEHRRTWLVRQDEGHLPFLFVCRGSALRCRAHTGSDLCDNDGWRGHASQQLVVVAAVASRQLWTGLDGHRRTRASLACVVLGGVPPVRLRPSVGRVMWSTTAWAGTYALLPLHSPKDMATVQNVYLIPRAHTPLVVFFGYSYRQGCRRRRRHHI